MNYMKNYEMNHDEMLSNMIEEKQIGLCKKELKKLFILGSYYALHHINTNRYDAFINAYNHREVLSYVYLAFAYALKQFRWQENTSINSFRNYFFELIRFYTIAEFKLITHWKTASQYKHLEKDQSNFVTPAYEESNHLINVQKINTIKKMLVNLNPIYLKIIEGKLQGFSHKEIAKQNNVPPDFVRSSFQYIKKIVRKKYSTLKELERTI
ncbi:DNA-directed RNA polymerase specialized sigma24 family protein [Mycoplasmoides fastidiosum]|uniref:DNA-directed RNA polymerase specialized sigma24 family protein n=1 Tax=Mycoplasmoides fastidiosum TaxID=92758 RepID=A0ABU0LYP4_9BACT|nr:hypothetical protein [Mycoplasmoides fastidiosum]MDQ0513829.1 DNA-directed RNA polymerase specialized sigma24 family protein [Mycoplasmoides fastidiosum]UUD37754.1 hypothetical protein NPA10_04290 [Mycoplasmoides fastidiosum]